MTTVEQRDAALAKANTVRTANAQMFAEIRLMPRPEGMARVARMLVEEGPWEAAPVYRLLTAPQRIGETKAAIMLRAAGVVSGDRRVRDLSPRQRDLLARLMNGTAA